jgi:hypothetical protein
MIPQKVGNIPSLAVNLGLIHPSEFQIYNECKGNQSIQQIGLNLQIDEKQIIQQISHLYSFGLISLTSETLNQRIIELLRENDKRRYISSPIFS